MQEIISFDVYIDEEEMTGVDKISLVKRPAILTDFIYMNDETQEQYKEIKFSDDDKMIITGPALIPHLEIIRKDEEGEPYYIKYSPEQIEKIAQKFFKYKKADSVNKEHKENKAEDTYIYESWIVGENDKSKELGFDVPLGTWMLSMKVDNPELWQQIKSGKYRGFSIEGLFKFKRSSRMVKQTCGCSGENVEWFDMAGEPGLVHPNCRCRIKGRKEFILGSARRGKDGEPIPCELCIQAKKDFEVKGEFKDVFDKKYFREALEDVELETYNDYPESAKNNAKRALEWAEKNGWGDCGTPVGKTRANQLAKGENISEDTIARMAAFDRHRQNKDTPYSEGCGGLMWDAWGGTSGIEWAQNKLKKIRKEKLSNEYNIDMDNVSLVKPGPTENEQEFISRCMGDDKMNSEFPEQEQRAAVCYAYWAEKQEKININMVSAILKDGKTLHTDADSMAVGVEVYFMEGEEKVSVDNGEYELEDGTVIFVEDSKIKEIKELEMGGNYSDKKEEEDMMKPEDKKEEKMEMDPMLMEQFDALKGMLENLNLKIDALIGDEAMSSVKQSLVVLEEKIEKISVEQEMKKVDTVDDKKKVAQSAEKVRPDYDVIVKYNKKF